MMMRRPWIASLLIGIALGSAGTYLWSRSSSTKYVDRFIRFVAREPLKSMEPGGRDAEYILTLSGAQSDRYLAEVILFVTMSSNGSISNASIILMPFDGYELPTTVRFAGAVRSIDFGTLNGAWFLVDLDHDEKMDVMRSAYASENGDPHFLFLTDGTWKQGTSVGRFEAIVDGERYLFANGIWGQDE